MARRYTVFNKLAKSKLEKNKTAYSKEVKPDNIKLKHK